MIKYVMENKGVEDINTNLEDKSADSNDQNSLKRNIIASNSKIHQELKDALKKNIE